MSTMLTVERLPGLPGEGPPPQQFTWGARRTHSEGVVFQFTGSRGRPWVANFQPGGTTYSTVITEPTGKRVFVVAGGQLYVVDSESKVLLETMGGDIEYFAYSQPTSSWIFGNGLWIESTGPCEWRTRRLSWDGMRNLRVEGARLLGEGYGPYMGGEAWRPFTVDLTDGTAEGGGYDGPT